MGNQQDGNTTRTARCRDCDRQVPSGKWNRIRAQETGWFFSRDGWATCPAHQPTWLHTWRNADAINLADSLGLTLCELQEWQDYYEQHPDRTAAQGW